MTQITAATENHLPELSVVILCYKAGRDVKDFVAKTITELQQHGIADYQLVLVGNYHQGSTDITPQMVQELAGGNNRIVGVTLPKQGMMGWDMRSGLNQATGRYIAVIDGDGQMPIEDLSKVYKKIKEENLDLVKTYRIVRGDGPWRKILSLTYNILFKILFYGVNFRDVNSKPKILNRASFDKLKLESNDWFIDAEIMIQARRYKFKIGEVPTNFLGLKGKRKSFVGPAAVWEFIKNLITYRLKEFKQK